MRTNVSGYHDVAEEITITREEFNARWNNVVVGIANDLVNALKRRCPVDEGILRNSIHVSSVTESKITLSMLGYALYVEFGTAPHIIRPVNGKALHWKSGGKDIFAKEVHHPGTRPNPFIRTTFRVDMPMIIKDNLRRHLLR